MSKVVEKKFEVIEPLRCVECGEEFLCDVLWNRDYRIRMARLRLKDSPINSEYFHSLCGKHKLEFFKEELAVARARGYIYDWDLEKMGIDVKDLAPKQKFQASKKNQHKG
jgi:hypothetical protein